MKSEIHKNLKIKIDNSKPIISIIIPFYNVESFLPKCLNSCKVQTIENLQFILVDDGSTDKSGEIADQFSMEDKRFHVYHTENHGLSAALNYGLTKADADWIMFIDGDDWVEPDFCKIPLTTAIEYEADLVIFNYYVTISNKITENKNNLNTNVVDFFSLLDFDDWYRWNKLFHRTLFEGIQYPTGIAFEDIFVTPKQAYLAKQIVYIPDRLYYYRKRENSILTTLTEKNRLNKKLFNNYFISRLEEYNFILEKGYHNDKVEKLLYYVSMEYLFNYWPNKNDELYQKACKIVNSIDISSEIYNWKHRMKVRILKIAPALFHIFYILKRNIY